MPKSSGLHDSFHQSLQIARIRMHGRKGKDALRVLMVTFEDKFIDMLDLRGRRGHGMRHNPGNPRFLLQPDQFFQRTVMPDGHIIKSANGRGSLVGDLHGIDMRVRINSDHIRTLLFNGNTPVLYHPSVNALRQEMLRKDQAGTLGHRKTRVVKNCRARRTKPSLSLRDTSSRESASIPIEASVRCARTGQPSASKV